jgi:hypothetical protein
MALIAKTKSGLKIEREGNRYTVSKGNQIEVYSSYGAMVRGLTTTSESKPKRHKAAKAAAKSAKARKAQPTVIYQAAAKPVKAHKAHKAAKPKAAKHHRRVRHDAAGHALKANGHKYGCKCLACSPETRKKALAARKRAAKGTSKPRKARKTKKGGGRGGAPFHGFNPSTRGYTFGDPEAPRYRGKAHHRPAPKQRPQRAEVYHGNVSRFNGGLTRRMPARMPFGYLPGRPGRFN